MFDRLRARWSTLGLKQVRRVIVFVVGMTVLLFGVALLVLPGPAILVIPAGLAILGLEFRWARRWMRRARAMIRSGEARIFRRSRKGDAGDGVAGSRGRRDVSRSAGSELKTESEEERQPVIR